MPDTPASGRSEIKQDAISRQSQCYEILDVRLWFAVVNSGGGSQVPGISDYRDYVPGSKTDPYRAA